MAGHFGECVTRSIKGHDDGAPSADRRKSDGCNTMTDKKAPDWERIEADYRAGVLSLREISAQHGSSPAGILKRAKRLNWDRDLAAKIKAKSESLVNKQQVNSQVNTADAVSERQIVDANALVIANVRLAHRTDISRARKLAMALFAELEAETGNAELFQQLGELLANGPDKLNDLYRKVISLPMRVDTGKKLSETLKNLIGLEREAYDLADNQPPPPPGESSGPTLEEIRAVLEENGRNRKV